MKRILGMAAVLTATTSMTAFADGHDCGWTPPGPIAMKIAFAAGGGADTQARAIAAGMEAMCGWTVVPEQVTGGGGVNLAVDLADDANDGTSIGMLVTESLGYNNFTAGAPVAVSDFQALSTTAGFQMAIVSQSDRFASIDDVIAEAGSGEVIFGTMSPKLSDLAFLFAEAQGVEFNITQVRGGKAVKNGIDGGDMDLGFMAGIQAGGVNDGSYIELMSAIGQPLALTASAPLLSDYGVDFDAAGWFAFVGPAGMPQEAVDALSSVIAKLASDPDSDAGAFINRAFGGPSVMGPADLQAQFESEFAAAAALVSAVEAAEGS